MKKIVLFSLLASVFLFFSACSFASKEPKRAIDYKSPCACLELKITTNKG